MTESVAPIGGTGTKSDIRPAIWRAESLKSISCNTYTYMDNMYIYDENETHTHTTNKQQRETQTAAACQGTKTYTYHGISRVPSQHTAQPRGWCDMCVYCNIRQVCVCHDRHETETGKRSAPASSRSSDGSPHAAGSAALQHNNVHNNNNSSDKCDEREMQSLNR